MNLESKNVTVIRPAHSWVSLKLAELWEYRELLYFLTWRDLKVRYKQMALGAAWAVLQPFLTMVVFSLFFGRLAKMPSDGIPYPLFSFAALLPWNYFAQSLTQASNSLVGNANLIRKVYFPRLIIPIANVFTGIVDFAIAFIVLIGLMIYYGIPFSVRLIWLPSFLLLALTTALGTGMWLSALNVQYRDVRYIMPFLIQLWMFVTPIIYPSSLILTKWRWIFALNPLTGIIEGYRASLLGKRFDWITLGISSIITLALFVYSAYAFRRMEKSFSDII